MSEIVYENNNYSVDTVPNTDKEQKELYPTVYRAVNKKHGVYEFYDTLLPKVLVYVEEAEAMINRINGGDLSSSGNPGLALPQHMIN